MAKNVVKFLVVGSDNARTYKELFPLFKGNRLFVGSNHIKTFIQPNGEFEDFGNISWYTNMLSKFPKKPIKLIKKYNENEYRKYDNYDAIDVPRVEDIPCDYDGVMGVPITFLDKYCSEQFEIIKFRKGDDGRDLFVDNEYPYCRVLIKNKKL